MPDLIPKGERDELRRLVRQQFKVLRSEVHQRHAELRSGAATNVLDKFTGLDHDRSSLESKAQAIIEKANHELAELGDGDEGSSAAVRGYRALGSSGDQFIYNPDRRAELVAAAEAAITSDTQAALLKLDRQEADLLRTLSVGALTSEAAHEFLGGIPTVGELVPVSRLAELEAGLMDEDLTREPNDWERRHDDY